MNDIFYGFIIRSKFGDKYGYWSGAYKESKWVNNIQSAKIYTSEERAQSTLYNHYGECYWENAEIIKVKIEEVK